MRARAVQSRFIPFVAFLALLAAPAQAAGFDCAQAGTEIEHMICGDAELSKLDELLSDRYVRALKKGEDPKAVKTAQRAWLRETRDACGDAACLKSAYEARVAELTKIGWMTDEKARAICERVSAALVDGSYHGAFRKTGPDEIIEIDRVPGLQGYNGPLNVDYDGDGTAEKLGYFGQYGGTCQSYSVSMILDITEGEPETNPSFDLEWQAGHQAFLVVDGEPVLARTPNAPKSVLLLDWLTPAGRSKPLCSIVIKRERRLKTVSSENAALCRSVAEGAVEFLSWNPPPMDLIGRPAAAMSGEERVQSISVDIDADGDDDTIAWVNYGSSAGCGYDHHWLVEMSDDLMSVAESPLNSVLIDKGPHIGAFGRWREWAPAPGSPQADWDRPRIFMFAGKPYILGRAGYRDDGAAVVSVWGGEEKTWCEFSYPEEPVGADIGYQTISPPAPGE